MESKHINPHDRCFRMLMQNSKVATEFFTKHLPQEIKNQVSLHSLELQKESHISDDLSLQVTDLLFTADFNGELGYIYLLIEHQSKPEKLMPFRILKYMTAIMEEHLHKHQTTILPIVYPMVMYSGKEHYNYSMNLFDLFGGQKELVVNTFFKDYQLVDLSKISDEELKQLLWYGTLARAMKSVRCFKDICQMLKQLIPELRIIARRGNFSVTIQPVDGDAHLWPILNEKALQNAHILACMLRFFITFSFNLVS